MKRIIIMMLRSIFLKKMYQQKKIQLLAELNSWPHPYHPCSNPLHHCVASTTECNSWLILVIYPSLAFFLRENLLSSHDNLYCCKGGEGRVHSVQYIQTSQLTLESRSYQGRHVALVDMNLSAKTNLITWVVFLHKIKMCCLIIKINSKIDICWYLASTIYSILRKSTFTVCMVKYLRISLYIRKPFLIYDFAPDPIWISLYMRKSLFSFLSVYGFRESRYKITERDNCFPYFQLKQTQKDDFACGSCSISVLLWSRFPSPGIILSRLRKIPSRPQLKPFFRTFPPSSWHPFPFFLFLSSLPSCWTLLIFLSYFLSFLLLPSPIHSFLPFFLPFLICLSFADFSSFLYFNYLSVLLSSLLQPFYLKNVFTIEDDIDISRF